MRVIHVLYGMNIGGAETFLYNLISQIQLDKYHIDVCIQNKDITNRKLYRLCKEKGCNIYMIPPFNKNYLAYLKAVIKMLKDGGYDIVHIHMNALINIAPIYIGAHYTGKVIVHSHNTRNNIGGVVGLKLHAFNRKILRNAEIIRVACGDDAGHWMFGNRSFTVLDNAICIKDYQYDEKNRQEVHSELGVNGKTVIGHVGRFVEAKNHRYLLNVFAEYVKIHPDTVLIMVGDGELLNDMKQKAIDLSIEDKTRFVGNRQNAARYYSAFDCMLFPSKFEGLPFVLVEAQVNGLPVVASDKVTTEMDLVGNMSFVALDKPIGEWINSIEKALKPVNRLGYAEKMKKTKYNIENMIKKVESLYDSEY